ncbi:type IV pilus assembly protein PilM [Vibrio metschnikovii]|nr:type IV pilus assembly protein PilM [Vibrio metschnikovii]
MSKSLVIGVDIGHHSIKAVALKPNGDNYSLHGCTEIVITDDIFADNDTLNYQKIVKKLKELKKSLPLFSRKVAIALPDTAVISKVLQIDSDLDLREKEFAIYQAFSHQSPLPMEELSLDFVPLPIQAFAKNRTATYQVYATRREVVASRLSAIQQAGLEATLLDVQLHGLAQIWQQVSQAQQRSNWMLVDVGYTQTTLCIDFADKAPFYKDIALGTRWFELPSLAETMARSDERNQWLFNRLFVERLTRQLQLFTSVHGQQSLAGIWLSGGGAMMDGLAETITEQLGLPCERFAPLATFVNKITQRKRLNDQPKFTTAAGLALRGIAWLESGHVA